MTSIADIRNVIRLLEGTKQCILIYRDGLRKVPVSRRTSELHIMGSRAISSMVHIQNRTLHRALAYSLFRCHIVGQTEVMHYCMFLIEKYIQDRKDFTPALRLMSAANRIGTEWMAEDRRMELEPISIQRAYHTVSYTEYLTKLYYQRRNMPWD